MIAAVLEEKFMLGEYRFGETLSIYALAEQFGSSRQPVAAAINHLRSSGYVEVIPQVGCRAVSPTPQEIDDFYQMFSKVEGVVSRLAAQRHKDGEPQALMEIARHIENTALFSLEERANFKAGIAAFHQQISNMARSPTLAARIDGLRRISNFYLWQGDPVLRPQTVKYMNGMRSKLAKAIAARDTETAERITEEHIRAKPLRAGIL